MNDLQRNDLCVYETSDYSKFKRFKGNRDIACAKRIIESINKIGYIPNPIIVNEKFEVIDGQNRLFALEELGMPVQYYVIQEIGIEEARALNLGRTNWKPIDYIESYAESGYESYQALFELINEYKGIYSSQELVGMLQNKIIYNGWCLTKIRDGNFTLSEKDYQRTLERIKDMKALEQIFEKIPGQRRTIVTGIAWCLSVEGCDKARFIDIIKNKYPLIRPVVEVELYLQDLTKLYNKGLKNSEKRIDFDVIARKESK